MAKPTAHDTLPPFIRALMDPCCYPHAAPSVELVETHISWVLLAGDFAYKIKKPVALGFLDFSTLDRRRHFCAEELRLNRRTAPQLYLDVLAITGTELAPLLGGTGVPFEYALKMRRFEQAALFDQLARHDGLQPAMLDCLAGEIAVFHAAIAVARPADPYGGPQVVAEQMRENFTHIARLAPPEDEARVLQRLRTWTESESQRLSPTYAARKAGGSVRECHGDLHLGNIALLDGAPVLFDCIEFSPALRWTDVISEIAFLVMDLLDRGLDALAWRGLNRYLEITGDYAGVTVLRHYLAYRVMVRAKVALIRARQDLAQSARGEAQEAFRHHLRLCERLTAPDRQPALILMHGLSGSGKTTVSQALLEGLGAVRLRSDVERKRLHGLTADGRSHSPVGGGLYDPAASQRTYAHLASLARLVLGAGWSVIVDAASLQRAERDVMRGVAHELAVPFVIVSCVASDDALRRRLVRRSIEGKDASEATAVVLDRQLAVQQPLAADEMDSVIVVSEAAGVADLVAKVLSHPGR